MNILQTRFQYYIFSECYRGLKQILEELEKQRNTTKAACGKSMISKNKREPSSNESIVLNINNGGECANVVELYSAGCVSIFFVHLLLFTF